MTQTTETRGSTMPEDTGRFRLDFDNLPLIEAAVRASFNTRVPLTYAVVNAVRQRLQPSFPLLSEPQQLEMAPGVGPSPTEFGPPHLPGAVYAGNEAGLTVSVHPQVIVARWVKQYVPTATKYPRFSSLRGALWAATEAFRQTVADEFPGIMIVNMSYVNFLPAADPASMTSYFSDQARLAAMATAQKVRKLEAAWSEIEGLDVRFAIEQVTANLGGIIKEGYRLTTAAGIRVAESLDAKSALDLVHDALQKFFLDLISEHAKQEWKLQEPTRA